MHAKLKQFGVFIAAAGTFAAGAATAQSIFGPDGEFSSFLGRLEWEPSCSKPRVPGSYASEWERDRFPAEVDTFIACVNREAQSDARYASSVISEGRDKALEDLAAEIRRAY